MTAIPKTVTCAALAVALLATADAAQTKAQAQVSAELARKCREMMIKAHPTQVFGSAGAAEAQRRYFSECIARQGRMPDGPADATTGQGGPEGGMPQR
jgi:hypothetical protein